MGNSPITSSFIAIQQRIWRSFVEALTGSDRDYTTGSIGRAITLLAIPMILEMLMQSVFGVVDIYFVGRLGAGAVAAVGLTESLLVLVLAVGLGLSMATTAMVARRVGEKDYEGAATASFQAFVAVVASSVPITLLGLFAAPRLLHLMGASAAVVEEGWIYCAIIFGSNATILFLFLINAIFRGAGDAALAMRVLWLANLLNIALDPLLIFGWGPIPPMGIAGAAIATGVGRGVGVVYQLHLLLGGRARFRILRAHARLRWHVLRRLVRIAGPGMLQYVIGTASWLALFRLMASFGSDAVAGYTIALRILIFALLPSWGMANAVSTLVGQNLGAGRPKRAERSVWVAGFSNAVFLAVVALGLIAFAEPLLRLFTDEGPVVDVGVECLRVVSYTYVFFGFGMVTVQAFNGAGDTRTPTWINFFCYWLLQIPLAYLLAGPFSLGATGVFVAIAIAQSILAVTGVVMFRKGRWKKSVV